MQERRKSKRYRVRGRVDYRGSAGIECIGVHDVGYGGIRLLLSGPERPGTDVQLGVRFSGFSGVAFRSRGQVAWARQREPFLAGIRWVEEDDTRDSSLDRLLTN